MTAVISDTTRRIFADQFLKEVLTTTDSDQYYIGIGKSDVFNQTDTTITPVQTKFQERDVRNNLQSIKKVEATSFVIDRHNWSSGQVYQPYSDQAVGTSYSGGGSSASRPTYVLTEDNNVFICIQQSRNAAGLGQASVVKPAVPGGHDRNVPFQLADGYVWKYLYSLSAGQVNSFLSANFMPIEKVEKDSSQCNIFELAQLNVQNTARSGQILGIDVTAGSSGYTSAPTVTIRGDGRNAFATATLNGTSVGKIEMDSFDAGLGINYQFAQVTLSGGGGAGATARPILSSKAGIGADPRNDLKANSVMFNIKPDGTQGGKFFVDQSFRQIGLFKNLKDSDNGSIFSGTAAIALRKMKSSSASSLTKGREISDGGSPPIKAFIDEISDSDIFYHQNDSTGFGVFSDNATTITDGINTITIDSANLPGEINPYSGEVLYMENRARVVRDTTQTEDIKVIFTV